MGKADPDSHSLFSESPTILLTEADIVTMAANGRLITGETFDRSCLQPTSYDFRVGKKAIVGGQATEIDLTKDGTRLVIEPGSYAGVISYEKVKLPANVLGNLGSKRKLSYEGLILLTGSVIDPGYEGHLLFGLYNASTKRRVIPSRTKICNVLFFRLSSDVKPVPPDPHLLEGNFPTDFLDKMANMEVLPWAQISDRVSQIQKITQDVLDLQAKYNNVLEPIKALTEDVKTVNNTVARLSDQVRSVSLNVDKLEDLYRRNSELVNKVSTNVETIGSRVKTQDAEMRKVEKKVWIFSILGYALWAILLIVIGALVRKYILP